MPRLGYVAERLKTMDIMNEHEVRVSVEDLEELVTMLKDNDANSDDFVYLTDLGRRGVFATHAHRGDEYHYGDAMTYYRNFRGTGFYKCDDCRTCKHCKVSDFKVICTCDEYPITVGFCSDELLEACTDYEEVTRA